MSRGGRLVAWGVHEGRGGELRPGRRRGRCPGSGGAMRATGEARFGGRGAVRFGLAALAVLTLGLASGVRPADAQNGADVQRAIEITQGVIDRASTTLDCPPGDPKLPCVYRGRAISLQASARASYGSGFLRDALALTLRARDRANSALRVGQDATGGEFIRFALERTDALLDRVAPVVRESGVDAALGLLDVASDAQRRAQQAALDGRPRLAMNGTYQARHRALMALRLADSAPPAGDRPAPTPDRARAMLELTDDLLKDDGWLSDAGGSAAPYTRALATQARAHARLDAGDARRAVELSRKSREALALAFARADRPIEQPRGAPRMR